MKKVPDLTRIIISVLALIVSGCASTTTEHPARDWRSANIHKVVVVCLQGDPQADRRIESHMVPVLRHQGLNAIASQDLIPAGSKVSPKNLMDQMLRAQIDGIMELTYLGEAAHEVPLRGLRLKYHSIKGQMATFSDRSSTLDAALLSLISDSAK